MDFSDITTVKRRAADLSLGPERASGQNFLTDKIALGKIVKQARVQDYDRILEIGPGFGILTKALLDSHASVLAVERDRRLAAHLKSYFKDYPRLRILEKDILDVSNKEIFDLLGGAFRVVSNIPYSITGKIIKKFVSSQSPKPESACVLVQKEVAQRICAREGKMSLIALSVQAYSKPRIAFFVGRSSFWPQPKVDSALLRMDDISEEPKFNADEKKFWRLARVGFSSPRKQLRNNLAAGLCLGQDEIRGAFERSNIKETARAQELGADDWARLARALD